MKVKKMKSNKMKLSLLLLVSLLTINVASANPGFNVDVTQPTPSPVNPGGTATYSLTITAMDTLDVEELAELSISVTDPHGNPVTWTPMFSENLFIIGPNSPAKTVTLQVTVPPGTQVGEYLLTVKGNGYLPDGSNPPQPDRFLGSIESSEFPLTVSVTQIPEFPTIAMPLISALGIVFLVSRRKEGNS